MTSVAIIGAGPSALVAARWLKSEGFEPVLYEQSAQLGGQWTGDRRVSGIWPAMHANSSRLMTAFSDLPHSIDTPVYAHHRVLRAYLERYAERFALASRIQFDSQVRSIMPRDDGRGWTVRVMRADGSRTDSVHARVIVASGRNHQPAWPELKGLETFCGSEGLAHSFHYAGPSRYRGKRVLVLGGSISALEIASELALSGATRVVTASRRQRYVFQKLIAGVPADQIAFTRFAALAGETFPPEAAAQALRELVIRTSGSPEQFGAPRPHDDPFIAGITQSQLYLPLVAEGRIAPKPWPAQIDGRRVTFSDGAEEEFDGVVCGSGYALHLPFLDEPARAALSLRSSRIELYHDTFHPALPGLAFLGIQNLVGPTWPVLELQARWIAYAWSGACQLPEPAEQAAAIAAQRGLQQRATELPTHIAAIQFARASGVEPDVAHWPELARALLFGPLAPVSFRLSGRDALPEAPTRLLAEGASSGAIRASEFTPEELQQMTALRHRTPAPGRPAGPPALPSQHWPHHGARVPAMLTSQVSDKPPRSRST